MAFKSNSNVIINSNNAIIFDSFKKVSGNTKSTEAAISPAGLSNGDQFSVGIAAGSGRIAVGAPYDDLTNSDQGSVYLYDLNGNQLAQLSNSSGGASDYFGYSVDLGNGRLVVGEPFSDFAGSTSGAVHLYDLNGTLVNTFVGSNSAGSVGQEVAIGSKTVAAYAPLYDNGVGAVFLFDLQGNETSILTSNTVNSGEAFGAYIDIAHSRVVTTAYSNNFNTGSVYIFDTYGNELQRLTASDGGQNEYFGYSIAIGSGRVVVGAPGANSFVGKAYVYNLSGEELAIINPSNASPNDIFGYIAAAIGSDTIAVGAYGANAGKGKLYLYDLDGNELAVLEGNNTVGGSNFGITCDIGSNKLVVGATSYDTQKGRAYTYDLPETHNSYWENILDS